MVRVKGILPDTKGVELAYSNGRLNVLKFLVDKGVLPDVKCANLASMTGKLAELASVCTSDVLKWLADLSQVAGSVRTIR